MALKSGKSCVKAFTARVCRWGSGDERSVEVVEGRGQSRNAESVVWVRGTTRNGHAESKISVVGDLNTNWGPVELQ